MVKKSDTLTLVKSKKKANESPKKTKKTTTNKKEKSPKAKKVTPAKKVTKAKVSGAKSEKTIYLKYIGYHIKNLDMTASKKEWKKLFINRLKNYESADEKDVKNLAISMYLASFAGLATCSDSFEILNKLESQTKIKAFLQDAESIKRKYGLPELSVVYYTQSKDILKHMKNNLQGQVSTVKEILR